ncbi:LysE family translocator [Salinisphaera aquimarina]|uniref:LysE family translocator n=1 Tax=Salinisphaera aquimarina TaxID=2094031 RepID=A0ABV7EV07_9GAMM
MNQDLVVVLTTLALYAGLVVSPGPGFALITRLSMSGARTAAYAASLGFAVGATFYAILTMTGLVILLERVSWLAAAVEVAGGCYLIYFGVSAWLSGAAATGGESPDMPTGAWRGFRIGLLVDLSNPKGIAFFLSLYSVAIPAGTALWAKAAILVGGFALEVLWYSLVALLLSSRPARATYRRFGGWIERGIGTVLAGFGARLIAARL